MDKEIEATAKRFLDQQFAIMKKYGSEPKLSNEQYQDVLAEAKKDPQNLR